MGEGADSGTVVNLFVKEGDQVAKDQPILELENEKAVATIPATAAGTVSKIFVKAGDKISVGQKILALSENGAAQPAKSAKPEATPKAKTGKAEPEQAPEEQETPEQESESEDQEQAPTGVELAAAPSIRKMARDLGLDLTRVRGSERGGRCRWQMSGPISKSCNARQLSQKPHQPGRPLRSLPLNKSIFLSGVQL